MTGIFNAVKDFFKTIIGIIDFVFKGLMMMFNLLFKGIAFLASLFMTLPAPFIGGALALVVVCVLYKVLGRETQS